jgi:hypothetical protein
MDGWPFLSILRNDRHMTGPSGALVYFASTCTLLLVGESSARFRSLLIPLP